MIMDLDSRKVHEDIPKASRRLVAGFRPEKPLPPPTAAAAALRARTLEVIERWEADFAAFYPQVVIRIATSSTSFSPQRRANPARSLVTLAIRTHSRHRHAALLITGADASLIRQYNTHLIEPPIRFTDVRTLCSHTTVWCGRKQIGLGCKYLRETVKLTFPNVRQRAAASEAAATESRVRHAGH